MSKQRGTALLTLKKITRVAFVRRGANQHSHISFAKSADSDPDNPTAVEKEEDPMSDNDAVDAKITRRAHELAKEHQCSINKAFTLIDSDPEGMRLQGERCKALGLDDEAEAITKTADFIGG